MEKDLNVNENANESVAENTGETENITEAQPEIVTETDTKTETENENEPQTEPAKTEPKKVKVKKPKRIKNQLLFKKGGVSVAVTALFIAGVIIFNILFGILSDRLVLEYDFSKEKVNSLSSKNVNYIKKIDKKVKIIVCAAESDYESYVAYYANSKSIEAESSEYYAQTLKLIKKYAAYNKKIDLQFVDPNSSEFAAVSEKYGDKIQAPGDIIVSSEASGKERVKALSIEDIYDITEDNSYASMGYTSKTLSGNNIENALTGAISYVLNNNDKTIAVLTGHSSKDYTADYISMLKENNYTITTVKDKIIESIPEKCDEIVIPVPSVDFSQSEISVISEYLENGGKFGRGLVVFADAAEAYLPVLYDFLDEWGITVEEGKVFETNESNYTSGDPTTFGSYDNTTNPSQICITGNNVPLIASEKTNGCTVTVNFTTFGTAIAVPKDTPADFSATDEYEQKAYVTVITSEKGPTVIDATDENPPKSYVSAFSSSYFLMSEYNENQNVSNKNITLTVTENNCGAEKSDITFVKKSITNESFSDAVNEGNARVISLVFIFLIPLAVAGLGIFVYVKRRNAK